MVASQHAAFYSLIVKRHKDGQTGVRVDAFAWRINRLEQRALGTACPRRRCLARVRRVNPRRDQRVSIRRDRSTGEFHE
jgi:hypothetical protein